MQFKLVVLLALVLVCSHYCHSQSNHFSVKAGLNAATITGTGIEGHIIPGYHIGLAGELKLNNKWILQPEILFSNQGYKNENFKYSFNYFNLPILFKRQYQKFFFDFGPQLELLFNAKRNDLSGSSNKEDISTKLNNLKFAFATGVGFKASKKIGLECRYMFDYPNSSDGDDFEFSNSVIQLSLLYMFN